MPWPGFLPAAPSRGIPANRVNRHKTYADTLCTQSNPLAIFGAMTRINSCSTRSRCRLELSKWTLELPISSFVPNQSSCNGAGGAPNGMGAIMGGGGKFSCGGYGIGFIQWPNPGTWGKGIHTLCQPWECLLLLPTNVTEGDEAQVPSSSSSSVQLLGGYASPSVFCIVSIGNWQSQHLLIVRDIEIAHQPSAIVIGKTCWCAGYPIQVMVFVISSTNSWASCR